MSNVEIYSGNYCGYCVRAKALLEKKGVAYKEYNVQQDASLRQEMLERAHGARTIPQIFINGQHVGGCDELYALERQGELDVWLNSPASEISSAALEPG